jgi:hypothetical protein
VCGLSCTRLLSLADTVLHRRVVLKELHMGLQVALGGLVIVVLNDAIGLDQSAWAITAGSVSFRAVQLRKFPPSWPALKLSPGQRGQSRFSAYATRAALRREHVGAYGIFIAESFAVRHSRDSSVPLIQYSSVQASVDIDP